MTTNSKYLFVFISIFAETDAKIIHIPTLEKVFFLQKGSKLVKAGKVYATFDLDINRIIYTIEEKNLFELFEITRSRQHVLLVKEKI